MELKDKLASEGLTLMNYKEPLKSIPKSEGVGYYGALIGSLDGEKVQCHVCGEMFPCIQLHAYEKHKLRARDYKEKFQLAYSTALISEKQREIRKERQIEVIRRMTPEQRAEWRRKGLEAYKKWMKEKHDPHAKKQTLETKNKRGTCPDQLLDRIKKVKESLGHVPTLGEFMYETGGQRFKHLIIKTFGSWNKALVILGYQTNSSSFEKNPITKKTYKRWNKEELIEYLKIFYQENGVPPSHTDFKRRLLPPEQAYIRNFGSMRTAKRLAEVPVWNRWQRLRNIK